MKLYVKDGRLRFDYEFGQTDIFTDGDFDFTYVGKGQREYVPSHINYKGLRYPYEMDWAVLSAYVELCKGKGVTITPEAQRYIDEFKIKAEADTARRESDEAERAARRLREEKAARWKLIQKHGCRGCAMLRQTEDDYVCKHTGDILPIENKPQYYEGVYYLFNYEPFPCEGCKYKYEEESDELAETDKHTA